ncbi:hypothetical protein RhiirA4_465844 [Rhizophagus irregularis]|uniref:Uncharacterized protein n=1 Tax=Rhizophagus irregularis TaxID=588596 RepID=A0A2I1GSW7_9GLOM|nr:hypothetical protein RhiirA4_465844 [Rhizophagus irregularis]
MRELDGIFKSTSNEMEWEAIRKEALVSVGRRNNLTKKVENYNTFGRRLVNIAEQNDILKEYTTLNDDFTKRLKDENREMNEKKTGDKRIKNSPPAKKFQKRWRVEDKKQ